MAPNTKFTNNDPILQLRSVLETVHAMGASAYGAEDMWSYATSMEYCTGQLPQFVAALKLAILGGLVESYGTGYQLTAEGKLLGEYR